MPQPTPYVPAYSFKAFQRLHSARPLPADKVDAEYAALQATIDEIIARMEIIQRDDGNLATGSVGLDQLKPEILLGVDPTEVWETSHDYTLASTVMHGTILYRCAIEHTSGTFSTDLSNGKWDEIIDLVGPAGAAGASGNGVRSGSGAPSAGLGSNGDFYIDTTAKAIYGPKTAGAWGSSTSIIGPSGSGTGDLIAANNLSDVSNAASARANLGLIIGTNVQAYNALLAGMVAGGSGTDKVPYYSAPNTVALADITAAGRALIDDAAAVNQRTTLGLRIGTDVAEYRNNYSVHYKSVADLKLATSSTLPAIDGQTCVTVAGYYAGNKYGGATFRYNSAAATADDFLVIADASSRKWELVVGPQGAASHSAGVKADHDGSGTWANHATATAYASTTDDTVAVSRMISSILAAKTPLVLPIGGMRIVQASGAPFIVADSVNNTFSMRGAGRRSYFLLDGTFTDYFLQIGQTGLGPDFGPSMVVPNRHGAVVLENFAVYGAGRNPVDESTVVNQKGILLDRSPHIQGAQISGLTIMGIPGTGLCLGGTGSHLIRETAFRDILVNTCGTLTDPAMIVGGPTSNGPNNLRFYELSCGNSRWIGLSLQSRSDTANANLFDYLRLENCLGPALVVDGGWTQTRFRNVKINSTPTTVENTDQHYVQFLQGNKHSGTAQAGSLTTITLASSASASNDTYNDLYVSLRSGTGAGQVAQIDDYTGATKVATLFGSWVTAPDATTTYQIGSYSQDVEWSGNIESVPSGFLIEGGADYTLDFSGYVDNDKILSVGAGLYGNIDLNWRGTANGYIESDARSSLYIGGAFIPPFFTESRVPWVRYERAFRAESLARASTTSVSRDGDLEIDAPTINSTYLLRFNILYWTSATADLKFSIVHSGGTTTSATTTYRTRAPGALSTTETTVASLPTNIGVTGATGYGFLEVEVTIVVGASAGSLRFNWAQNTSDATPTVVLKNSTLEMLKLSP